VGYKYTSMVERREGSPNGIRLPHRGLFPPKRRAGTSAPYWRIRSEWRCWCGV